MRTTTLRTSAPADEDDELTNPSDFEQEAPQAIVNAPRINFWRSRRTHLPSFRFRLFVAHVVPGACHSKVLPHYPQGSGIRASRIQTR